MRLPTEAQNISLRQTVRDLPDNPSPIFPVYYDGERVPKLPEIPKIPKPEKLLRHITYSNGQIIGFAYPNPIWRNHGPLTGTFIVRNATLIWDAPPVLGYIWNLTHVPRPVYSDANLATGSAIIPNPSIDEIPYLMNSIAQTFLFNQLYHTILMERSYLCLRLFTYDDAAATQRCNYTISLEEVP